MLIGEVNLIVNELTAEKWVYGGDALSRVEGRVVMTPYLIPGETAKVEQTEDRRGLIRAVPREIVTPSPERVQPPCPYFFRCGGCHYQHAAYEFQVRQKAEILREQLRRVGRVSYDGPIETIAGPPLAYRNRTQFHLDGRRIGYFGEGSHELVPIEQCPISSPKINESLEALLAMMRDRRWPKFVRAIELFTNEREVVMNIVETAHPVSRRFFDWAAERIPGAERGWLEYEAAGHRFQVSHNSFFQVNRFLVDRLVEAAIPATGGGLAFDLYAGVGLFSVQLARIFERVTAVESSASAARDLKMNADAAGVAIEVAQASVEVFLAGAGESPEVVLADPPRAGLGKSVTAALLRLKPARIVLVACDPATLARDLGALTAGGYGVERLVMVDLFPNTYHLETVAALRLG
jgi:23S rRNA (uracil1939-C5)-methyltransferase